MVGMTRKKIQKEKEGYSPEELRVHMHAYIKASAERLRKELRDAWRKQAASKRRARHEIAV